MDSAKLNDWLQVIGVFGVIASLIFVGLQLKQTQEIALAAQYHARAAATMDHYNARLESGFDFSNLARPAAELSPSDLNANHHVWGWAWTHMENMHFQHKAGFLSDEAWDGFQRVIASLKSGDVPVQAFERRRMLIRRSFVEEVERIWQEAGD